MASKRYRFLSDYRNGDTVYSKGQIADFDEERAAWMNRDVPGCIEEVDEKAERAALEAEIIAKAKAKEEKDAAKAAEAAEEEAKKQADEEKARAKEAATHDRMQRAGHKRGEG